MRRICGAKCRHGHSISVNIQELLNKCCISISMELTLEANSGHYGLGDEQNHENRIVIWVTNQQEVMNRVIIAYQLCHLARHDE